MALKFQHPLLATIIAMATLLGVPQVSAATHPACVAIFKDDQTRDFAHSRSRAQKKEKVVIITGAGTGLGLAIAKSFIQDGARVVMTARKTGVENLRKAGFENGPRLLVEEMDVTDPAQRQALLETVQRTWGGVDVLINNAAVIAQGAGEHVSSADLDKTMKTNFVAPREFVQEILPLMHAGGGGQIINISSMSATIPSPTMGAYAASKAALSAYMEALALEVAPQNIAITNAEPGYINSGVHEKQLLTDLAKIAQTENDDAYKKAYQQAASSQKLASSVAMDTPDSIAKKILRLSKKENPPTRATLTNDSRILNFLKGTLPDSLFRKFLNFALYIADARDAKSSPSIETEKPCPICTVLKFVKVFGDKFTEDLSFTKVSAKLGSIMGSRKITLAVGDLIGRGMAGAVYGLDGEEQDRSIRDLQSRYGRLIIKFPHSVKGSGGRVLFPQAAILQKREIVLNTLINEQLPQIEKAASYPKSPAWTQGQLPVIPILAVLDTNLGRAIVKPFVQGLNLAKLYQRGQGQLTPEMESSLREIYGFAQALFQESHVTGLHPADPFGIGNSRALYLDLNPSNLVWIEDPVTMKSLGLSRPSFILFELGEYVSRKYEFPRTTFSEYLGEFRTAIISEGKAARADL